MKVKMVVEAEGLDEETLRKLVTERLQEAGARKAKVSIKRLSV